MTDQNKPEGFSAFENLLGRVLQVPKSELERRLAEEKEANKDKPKRGRKPKSK